ncbi:MAG: energy transducer TonB [Verrucomicrobiota bacterium]
MDRPTQSGQRLVPAIIAAILTFALFLLLPLSRFLSPLPEQEVWTVREINRIEVPPPPPPKLSQTEPTPGQQVQSPNLQPLPSRVTLDALPITLSVNPDPDLTTVPSFVDLSESFDAGEEIRRFTFEDLDGGPVALSVPPVSIPLRLARSGFGRGRVVFSIRILTDGSVEILDVVESSHPDLIEPARRSARRARFETPKINGEPVEVEGHWPLVIDATRR